MRDARRFWFTNRPRGGHNRGLVQKLLRGWRTPQEHVHIPAQTRVAAALAVEKTLALVRWALQRQVVDPFDFAPVFRVHRSAFARHSRSGVPSRARRSEHGAILSCVMAVVHRLQPTNTIRDEPIEAEVGERLKNYQKAWSTLRLRAIGQGPHWGPKWEQELAAMKQNLQAVPQKCHKLVESTAEQGSKRTATARRINPLGA